MFFLVIATGLVGANLGYVVSNGGNSVFVVDLDQSATIDTIAVGSSPFQIALSPDESIGYVTNSGGNTVSVVDLIGGLELSQIGVGDTPLGIAVTPDGEKVVVVNNESDNVTIINLVTQTVEATVTVGIEPFSVAIRPDGTRAYVTNQDDTDVSVIDLSTSTVTASIPVVNSQGIVIDSSGNTAYISSGSEDAIFVVNLNDNTITTTISVLDEAPNPVIAPERNILIYPILDESIVNLVDLDTFTITATITVGFLGPFDAVVSPDESLAYITNIATNTVSVLDLDELQVFSQIFVGENSVGIVSSSGAPPSNFVLTASSGRDRHLTQTDLFNRLRWTTPSPEVTLYGIYIDEARTELVGSVSGEATEFIHHNRRKGETITYYIVAYDGTSEVAASTVTITTE